MVVERVMVSLEGASRLILRGNDDEFTTKEIIEYYNAAIEAMKSMPTKIEVEEPGAATETARRGGRGVLSAPWER